MSRNDQSDAMDGAVPGGEAAVREQLERLCGSVEFADSPRAAEFLRHVVGEMLAGRGGGVSQRSIADAVYGRGPDFDPGIDPLVRMQARRVRRALEHYYLTAGKHDVMVVDLPKGSYRPRIRLNGHVDVAGEAPGKGGASPMVMVSPFRNDTGCGEFELIARGLSAELAMELGSYETARVVALPGCPGEDPALGEVSEGARKGGCCYLVEGSLGMAADSLRVLVRLVEASTGILQWSHEGVCRAAGDERDRLLDGVVKRAAASIAEEQGVVARNCIERMGGGLPGQPTSHELLLQIYSAERSGSLDDFGRALSALRDAVEREPEDGRLWSGLARLCGLNHGLELLPGELVPIEEVIGYAERGVRLRGEDRGAWCILGFAHTIAGNLQAGHEATLSARARNPRSMHFRDVIGYLLTLQGDWDRGRELSREAVELNPFVRPAVYCGLWLDAFRREDFEDALSWAWRFMGSGTFWAPLMRAAAGVRLGDRGGARKTIAQLLRLRPDLRANGGRLIRHFVKFEDLACRIEEALGEAGLEFPDAGGT